MTPSAIVVGAAVSGQARIRGIHIEGEAGYKAVYSPASGTIAGFASYVIGANSGRGGKKASGGGELSFGFAFNTPDSDTYESNWLKGATDFNIALPVRQLPRNIRERLYNLAASTLLASMQAPLDFLSSLSPGNTTGTSPTSHYVSMAINSMDRLWVNISVSPTGSTDFSVIFDYELGSIEASSGIAFRLAGTTQLHPSGNVLF